jgi:hypothetical protein
LTYVEVTRHSDFRCPECGEIIKEVTARNGIVRGWCPSAKKPINHPIKQVSEEAISKPKAAVKMSYLDELVQKRDKVLKDVVSAREDGDLKENTAYHAAREQLSILDDKILREQERLKQASAK